MNFFEHQAAARRSTRRLIILFVLAVITIVLVIDAALLIALGMQVPSEAMAHGGPIDLLKANARLVAGVSIGTVLVIAIASLTRIGSLSAGGPAVAESLGASRVDLDTRDPQLRRLCNVVEEIAIAAATPVPAIYVLDDEQGINAFAAGYSQNDAAVAVTRGALEQLNRDELQGVIAHEFSHILNGDTRLNIRLMGVLFGILVLGIAGRRILVYGRGGRNSKNAGGILLAALVLMIVGYAGVFFGRLIKAGVSRSREYLADASAVQFTRQTRGIAGALKKIAGVPQGSRLVAADTEEVSHMLFGDGVGYSRLWATHPPLLDRIRALEPGFNPTEINELRGRWRASPPSGLDEDRVLGLAGGGAGSAEPGSGPTLAPLQPRQLHQRAGRLEQSGLAQAGRIHRALPPTLVDAAHGHDSAPALLLGLLLDTDPALRERQIPAIVAALGNENAQRVADLTTSLSGLHPLQRLPLAALAFPALRRRPRPQLERFDALCDELIHMDGRIELFEYCLGRLLRKQVVESLDPSRHAPNGRLKLSAVRDSVAALFAVLAAHGHADPDEARRAFAAGMQIVLPTAAVDYREPADWVAALDRAIDELDRLQPLGKQVLVDGLAACCSHDGRISVAEAELLRTVCASLHCPLPPIE